MYNYDRRSLIAIDRGELSMLIDYLGQVIRKFETFTPTREFGEAGEDYSYAYYLTKLYPRYQSGGLRLALNLLQTYQIPPKDRKLVERVAKDFSKTRVTIRKGTGVVRFKKELKRLQEFSEVARRMYTVGRPHDAIDNKVLTNVKVGSFTLVNTGGFDSKTMDVVKAVVEKAEKLLRSKGLGKVCYGKVNITNTVRKSTRVLAFYLVGEDDLYIRANIKGKQGPALRSVIHELGHRLHFKFLKSQNAGIKGIYSQLKSGVREAERDQSKWPPKGTEIKAGRTVWVVTGVKMNLRTVKYDIQLVGKEDSTRRATYPLMSWQLDEGLSSFVTAYASTDSQENFAEMIAFYCEDELPKDQVDLLKVVIT